MEYGTPPLKPLPARFLLSERNSEMRWKHETLKNTNHTRMKLTVFAHLEEVDRGSGFRDCCYLYHYKMISQNTIKKIQTLNCLKNHIGRCN